MGRIKYLYYFTLPMVKKTGKVEAKEIALEHIKSLFSMAKKDKKLSKRYIELAIKTSQRYKVKIPKEYSKKFCKFCYSLFDSKNSRYRIGKSRVLITCLNCNKQFRTPYRKEKRQKDR